MARPSRGGAALNHAASEVMLGVRASDKMLREAFGCEVGALARAVAEAVVAHERDERIGYYPALNALLPELDERAVTVMQDGARALARAVTAAVKTGLEKFFSSVRVLSARNLMYNLPPMRPGDGALEALSAHYMPDRFRVLVRVEQIQHREAPNEKYESFVVNMCHLWLRDSGVALDSVVAHRGGQSNESDE